MFCYKSHQVLPRRGHGYIRDDEYLEITPTSLRIRKIILDEIERKRARIAAGYKDE